MYVYIPDLPTLTRSHLWDWPYKPVRKPARNLRRLFRSTITQISIMKTLTKHQIAGNKSFIFFYGVSHCYRALSIRQKHFWSSHVSTVKQLLLLYVFFRLSSAVLNKSKHWVKKLHPNVCSIRLVNNKTKKKRRGHWLCNTFYMELFLLSQILSPDGSTPMHKI